MFLKNGPLTPSPWSKKEDDMDKNDVTDGEKTGISFGSAFALVMSYVNWHSIFWAIVHGVLGWVYVIYYILRY